jgi:hypothetical protein
MLELVDALAHPVRARKEDVGVEPANLLPVVGEVLDSNIDQVLLEPQLVLGVERDVSVSESVISAKHTTVTSR